MSKGKPRTSKRILILGESENDKRLIRQLLISLRPDLAPAVKIIRRPQVLIKDASERVLPKRFDAIAAVVRAEQATADVVCIFAHEDCDALEPAHEALAKKIQRALEPLGVEIHAVTPAWETETWLFLWPEAVASYRPSWPSLDKYRGKNVGLIENSKERLAAELRGKRKGGSIRGYRESDAPLIAEKVAELNIADCPSAQCLSYTSFRASVSTVPPIS